MMIVDKCLIISARHQAHDILHALCYTRLCKLVNIKSYTRNSATYKQFILNEHYVKTSHMLRSINSCSNQLSGCEFMHNVFFCV